MRLDKYLKVSRIIKRRTVANEACDAGRVLVNGKVQRASYDVKSATLLPSISARRLRNIRCLRFWSTHLKKTPQKCISSYN
jgi:ribosomal 50S subunit-recycling heat shock protein